jgi:hypothetical protein
VNFLLERFPSLPFNAQATMDLEVAYELQSCCMLAISNNRFWDVYWSTIKPNIVFIAHDASMIYM